MSKEPKDIFAILSEIKTIDDLKENEKLIVETAVSKLEAGLEAVKALADSALPTAEAITKYNQIQTDQQSLKADIDEQFDRIGQIPGADDIIMSIQGELVGRMGAITSHMMNAFSELLHGPPTSSAPPPSSATGPPQPPGPGEVRIAGPSKKYERIIFTGYTPAEGETFEIVELLKSIHSGRGFEIKKSEIIKQQHKFFKNELEKIKEFQGKDQASDEVQAELKDFTYRYLYVSSQIGNEFSRLDAATESTEPMIGLDDDLAKKTMEMGEEIMKILEELGADKMEEFSKPPDTETVTLGEEREVIDELVEIYKINSGEELLNIKDDFINKIVSILETHLKTLQNLKSGAPTQDEAVLTIDDIDHRMYMLGNEMDNEFERIQDLPGGDEAASELRDAFMNRLGSMAEEIEGLLDELRQP